MIGDQTDLGLPSRLIYGTTPPQGGQHSLELRKQRLIIRTFNIKSHIRSSNQETA